MPMTFIRNILILICCTLPSLVQGQYLLHGPDEDINEGSRLVQVIGKVGDLTACFMERYDGYAIIWYDSLMRKAGVSKLEFLEKGTELFRFYETDDAVNVFYQKRSRKKVALLVANIPPLHRDTIIPQQLDSILLDGNWDKTRFALFDVSVKNRFGYTSVSQSRRNGLAKVRLNVIDNNFNSVLRHEQEFDRVSNLGIIDLRINKNDELYLLMANGLRRDNFYSELWMGILNEGQRKINLRQLKLDGQVLASPKLITDLSNNRFVLGGMLYRQSTNNFIGVGAFPFSMIAGSWGDAKVNKINSATVKAQNLDLNDLRLRKFLAKKDGGYTYILEKSFKKTFTRSRSMGIMAPNIGLGSSSYSVYHDDELYVISTNYQGTINWNKTILKSQETSDANVRFQSFGMLRSSIGNVFLFRDKLNGDQRFITAFLSNKGKLTLRQFDPSNYKDIATEGLLLKAAKQIAVNQIVFPIISRGTLSFAKIVF